MVEEHHSSCRDSLATFAFVCVFVAGPHSPHTVHGRRGYWSDRCYWFECNHLARNHCLRSPQDTYILGCWTLENVKQVNEKEKRRLVSDLSASGLQAERSEHVYFRYFRSGKEMDICLMDFYLGWRCTWLRGNSLRYC